LKNNSKNIWLGLIGGLIVGLIVGWLLFGAISTEGQASKGMQSQPSAYGFFENIESKTIDGVDYLGGKLVSGVNFIVDNEKIHTVYLLKNEFSTQMNNMMVEYNNNGGGQAFRPKNVSNNAVSSTACGKKVNGQFTSCSGLCKNNNCACNCMKIWVEPIG